MKKLLAVSLVVILLLATAMPAFAAHGAPAVRIRAGASQFTLAGKISAIDAGAGTVTVRVLAGSRPVHGIINKDVTIYTTPATRYLLKTAAGTQMITFADLQAGQNVSVQGIITAKTWTASRITVGALLLHR